MRYLSFFCLFFLILLSGCSKGHLYVQQEWINSDFLASTHVDTPDPRQEDPPKGQRIITSWDFPLSWFRKEPSIFLTVRFWDNTQDVFFRPIEKKRGFSTFFFSNPEEERDKRILTYRVQILSKDGEILETWEHQFWTELIDIGDKEITLDKEKMLKEHLQIESNLQ